MSGDTKKAALAKLKAITNNVGSPEKWRDYSRLAISRDDYFGNCARSQRIRIEARDRQDRHADATRANGP